MEQKQVVTTVKPVRGLVGCDRRRGGDALRAETDVGVDPSQEVPEFNQDWFLRREPKVRYQAAKIAEIDDVLF